MSKGEKINWRLTLKVWEKGDKVLCPQCGGEAHYKPPLKPGSLGKFVCEKCGEEIRFLSEVSGVKIKQQLSVSIDRH